nr:immunoglobulin heavy chain junction region [Mus musculus]
CARVYGTRRGYWYFDVW